jgi:hypothetical protein
MNSILKNSGILLSTLILAACGSDDDHSHGDAHDEHEHSLMISQQNTTALSFLEEGTAENLDDAAAANGARLILSNTGEQAAIETAGQVQFVAAHHEEEEEAEEEHTDEEHELPELSTYSVSGNGIETINTNGHFSVLADGSTHFVPYETVSSPEVLDLGIEVYPALLLEETATEMVVLTFIGTSMVATEIGETNSTLNSENCTVVNSVAQNAEFAVVSCDDANFVVTLDESGVDHAVDIEPLMDTGLDQAIQWKTAAGVFVGLGADNQFYVLEENETTEVLELEGSFAATETVNETTVELCAWGIDSLEAEIFALTATELTIFDHDATSHSITLDETQGATCGDLRMATASQAVFVLDNNGAVLYEIDKEEGASQYHIHGRETLSVTDIESAVIFHEVGTDSHSHSHE